LTASRSGVRVISSRRTASGPKIPAIGHLDTVFPADSPFQKFARLDANTAEARIIDRKGGDVIIVQALRR
jgi:glutamate carboxypeptidase